MLPLNLANNYTPTLLFCGGMDPERDELSRDSFSPSPPASLVSKSDL